MKESVAYKFAQCSVLHDTRLNDYDKLAILKILMDREDMALFREKEEAQENAK